MLRLFLYIALLVLGLLFWANELVFNYYDYVGHDPTALAEDYQKAFVSNYGRLLLAELILPFILALGFLLALLFKFAGKSSRWALGFLLFLSTEFWAYRAFFFTERMLTYHLRTETKDPTLILPDSNHIYFFCFLAALLMVIFIKERQFEAPKPEPIDENLVDDLERRYNP